jgi:hypothetical protein
VYWLSEQAIEQREALNMVVLEAVGAIASPQ